LVFKGLLFYFVFQSTFKMNNKNYLEDISQIKNLMAESSKFLVFTTGLSGLFSGLFAIAGITYIYFLAEGKVNDIQELVTNYKSTIAIVLVVTLAFSTLITFLLTKRNAKSNGQNPWNPIAKKMVFNFYSVGILGGIYVLILFFQEKYEFIVELMLIFYGMALLNGSKYTFDQVKFLAYIQIALGLICSLYPTHDFWFWIVGFGFVNLIYGGIMYFGYGK